MVGRKKSDNRRGVDPEELEEAAAWLWRAISGEGPSIAEQGYRAYREDENASLDAEHAEARERRRHPTVGQRDYLPGQLTGSSYRVVPSRELAHKRPHNLSGEWRDRAPQEGGNRLNPNDRTRFDRQRVHDRYVRDTPPDTPLREGGRSRYVPEMRHPEPEVQSARPETRDPAMLEELARTRPETMSPGERAAYELMRD